MAVSVVDAPQRNRFEARDGDAVIGVVEYRRDQGTIRLDHVEVVPAFRGKGIADQLMRAVVARSREAGLDIVPVCPYAVTWFASHLPG